MNQIQTQIAKDNSNAIMRLKLSKNLEEFNLKQAKALLENPEEFLTNLMVQNAIRKGYSEKAIGHLCKLIQRSMDDFREYKEKAESLMPLPF